MRILLSGCAGRMGQAITARVSADPAHTIVAGIDRTDTGLPYPVYLHPADCRETADVLIAFSNPSLLAEELAYATAHRLPAVIATTGLDEAQQAALHTAAAAIPVFYSGNMSVGVALLSALTRKAAAVLGTAFDVEILEMHHNQKLDAPSGTALMLAQAARDGLPYEPEYVYDRHSRRQKRALQEIGISSVRGGSIVGEHQVIFAGDEETVILTHRAQSRGIFAVGALRAAAFLQQQPAGLYTMDDLLANAE